MPKLQKPEPTKIEIRAKKIEALTKRIKHYERKIRFYTTKLGEGSKMCKSFKKITGKGGGINK